MNRLVIIGNGFDLAHGLKTSYKDFILWYFDQYFKSIFEQDGDSKQSDLLQISIPGDYRNFVMNRIWPMYVQYKIDKKCKIFVDQLFKIRNCHIETTPLYDRIVSDIETKGWTDIENDYYWLLKKNSVLIDDEDADVAADAIAACEKLNNQLDFLKMKLAEYLETQQSDGLPIESITSALNDGVDENDIEHDKAHSFEDSDGIVKCYDVSKTMFLNFNYTATVEKYKTKLSEINYIHGSLEDTNKMIFGYGDEMDKDFKGLEDKNINELLKNSKSVRYVESNNYRRLLHFIDGDLFQVYIMGHSCGNSDRTLLNTIFEHPNCISIKPFIYKDKKEQDNYSELSMNIYRNFSDKKLFRDRVVVKPQCDFLVK